MARMIRERMARMIKKHKDGEDTDDTGERYPDIYHADTANGCWQWQDSAVLCNRWQVGTSQPTHNINRIECAPPRLYWLQVGGRSRDDDDD